MLDLIAFLLREGGQFWCLVLFCHAFSFFSLPNILPVGKKGSHTVCLAHFCSASYLQTPWGTRGRTYGVVQHGERWVFDFSCSFYVITVHKGGCLGFMGWAWSTGDIIRVLNHVQTQPSEQGAKGWCNRSTLVGISSPRGCVRRLSCYHVSS